jgi:hypothetical protein
MLHSLVEGLLYNNEAERAFLFLRDVRAQGVIPKRNTYNLLIGISAALHEAEEMFRLLLDFKDTWGENSIHENTWWKVLDACAEEGYVRPLSSYRSYNLTDSYPDYYILGGRCRMCGT